MDELNLLLYVLAILVFAFAGMVALGHGIWVLAARVLRALSGGKEPPAMSQDAGQAPPHLKVDGGPSGNPYLMQMGRRVLRSLRSIQAVFHRPPGVNGSLRH